MTEMHTTRLEKFDADLVEQITNLHELCVPVSEIGRRFLLRKIEVEFVLQRRRLPQRNLKPFGSRNRKMVPR